MKADNGLKPLLLLTVCIVLSLFLCAASLKQFEWAHPRMDWPGWYKVHGWYVSDAENARQHKGIQLLFYGDSITQCWRFGAHGFMKSTLEHSNDVERSTDQRNSVCTGAPQVFDKYFGSKYNAKVFGIGGDQTPELMYRLLHGEGPQGLNTKVAVLLIGTNDLGYAMAKGVDYMRSIANTTADHVTQISDYLTSFGVDVVLMGILQRGEWHQPAGMFAQPSDYTDPINSINSHLKSYAANNPRVHYVYCGDGYLIKNGAEIDRELMPDALHPSAKGFEVMAQCLQDTIAQLMGH